jgi:hypothetical protein
MEDDAIAREAIRHILSLYTNAGDRGALSELAAAFAPDGVLEMFGGSYRGREAIIERLSAVVDPSSSGPDGVPLGFLRHHLTSCYIELVGPTTPTHGRTSWSPRRSGATTRASTSIGSRSSAAAG